MTKIRLPSFADRRTIAVAVVLGALVGCGGDDATGPTEAVLELSSTSVAFVAVPDGSTLVPESVEVENAGGGTLGDLSVKVIYQDETASWLDWTLSDSTAPATLTLTADVAGLSPGEYTATLAVAASAASGESSASLPVSLKVTGAFERVVMGTLHTCAVTTEGEAYCWGDGDHGRLGNGTTTQSATPVAVSGGVTFTGALAASTHTCGITPEGQSYCWGMNHWGQLGDGSTTDQFVPVQVLGGYEFTTLGAGGATTCALTAAGDAYCWGHNRLGKFGNGEEVVGGSCETRPGPVGREDVYCWSPVPAADGLALHTIQLQFVSSCGLTVAGEAFCWGSNDIGTLGDGTTTGSSLPVPVDTDLRFAELSAAQTYACGLTDGGVAHCWGHLPYRSLEEEHNLWEQANITPPTTPQPVEPSPPFLSVSVGFEVACGLTEAGEAYCWGDNRYGQLGDGTTGGPRMTPQPVVGGHTFKSLTAGYWRACGVTTEDTTYCWGNNLAGRLGDGTTTNRSEPVPVLGP